VRSFTELGQRVEHYRGGNVTLGAATVKKVSVPSASAALWDDESMAEVFLDRACFLYYAFHQLHGPRGDVIAEMERCVGQLLDTLDELVVEGMQARTVLR
jgi:hypothetical protein